MEKKEFTMDIKEQEHTGFVKSRTHDNCFVAEPVVVVIEGQEIELSLHDAKWLLSGLQEAVTHVEESETRLKGDGNYNLAVIGKTGSGMSIPRTKLGAGGFIFIDGMADTDMYRQIFEISSDQVSAVLKNTNTRTFMKLPD
jgi:hypothetical protein